MFTFSKSNAFQWIATMISSVHTRKSVLIITHEKHTPVIWLLLHATGTVVHVQVLGAELNTHEIDDAKLPCWINTDINTYRGKK